MLSVIKFRRKLAMQDHKVANFDSRKSDFGQTLRVDL